jgi:hypothetical protein
MENVGAGASAVRLSWMTIGGQRYYGVKVYKYSYNQASMPRDEVILFGAAESDRIYCRALGEEDKYYTPERNRIFNCDIKRKQSSKHHFSKAHKGKAQWILATFMRNQISSNLRLPR